MSLPPLSLKSMLMCLSQALVTTIRAQQRAMRAQRALLLAALWGWARLLRVRWRQGKGCHRGVVKLTANRLIAPLTHSLTHLMHAAIDAAVILLMRSDLKAQRSLLPAGGRPRQWQQLQLQKPEWRQLESWQTVSEDSEWRQRLSWQTVSEMQ